MLTHYHSTYEACVSFDTFDNKDATDMSFTLIENHKNFVRSRRSRTFLCGMCNSIFSLARWSWTKAEELS